MEISGKVAIECDYPAKLIRVHFNPAPMSWTAMWVEVAVCKTSKEYYNCEFVVDGEKLRLSNLLNPESDAADAGFWFWKDVEPQPKEGEVA